MTRTTRVLLGRQSILNAVRGLEYFGKRDSSVRSRQCYKCFALEAHHIESLSQTGGTAATPADFHSTLCDRIRSAKQRVLLASLYIGPAVDSLKHPRENDLLKALGQAKQNNVDIKILLDLNRALRPVPISKQQGKDTVQSTTTSAQACYEALHSTNQMEDEKGRGSGNIFLVSALTNFWQSFLPNPYNEVMGVFHIKAYIIDDNLILSGANLSEEYFVDRHDRYLSIRNGGNGLVDFYVDLVEALCANAQKYSSTGVSPKSSSAEDLLESVSRVIMTNADSEDSDFEQQGLNLDKEQKKVVAVAVPTFQAPPRLGRPKSLRYDVDAIQDMIRASSSLSKSNAVLRIASAYLNPTKTFLSACERLSRAHMLTAGPLSHGFKPQKKKAGNKGKDWIPKVFDEIAHKIRSEKLTVWLYQRMDWTFHAKGLWVSLNSEAEQHDPLAPSSSHSFPFQNKDDLVAVTHGSGNFGARSEYRDYESNLVLVFPPSSPLAREHKNEWNEMGEFAVPSSYKENTKQLSWPFKFILPCIRSFF